MQSFSLRKTPFDNRILKCLCWSYRANFKKSAPRLYTNQWTAPDAERGVCHCSIIAKLWCLRSSICVMQICKVRVKTVKMPRYQKANSEAETFMLRSIPGMEKMVCTITQRITVSSDSYQILALAYENRIKILAH